MTWLRRIVTWFFAYYAIAFLVTFIAMASKGHPIAFAVQEALGEPLVYLALVFGYVAAALTGRAAIR